MSKRLVSNRDVLRVFRPTYGRIKGKTGSPYPWYFKNSKGKSELCRSGYEALFATYLTAHGIPFEYENLSLQITGKAHYHADFFLTLQGEFVELKGRLQEDFQQHSIRLLKRKGFVIHVLFWKELRVLIGSPCKDYGTLLSRAKAAGQATEDYFASTDWYPTVGKEETADLQKSIFQSVLKKPVKVDVAAIRTASGLTM